MGEEDRDGCSEKLVKKNEMGDPKSRKLMKKVEMGGMKVEELVKKIQMHDPKVGKVWKFGQEKYTKLEQDAMLAGAGEEDKIHQVL